LARYAALDCVVARVDAVADTVCPRAGIEIASNPAASAADSGAQSGREIMKLPDDEESRDTCSSHALYSATDTAEHASGGTSVNICGI